MSSQFPMKLMVDGKERLARQRWYNIFLDMLEKTAGDGVKALEYVVGTVTTIDREFFAKRIRACVLGPNGLDKEFDVGELYQDEQFTLFVAGDQQNFMDSNGFGVPWRNLCSGGDGSSYDDTGLVTGLRLGPKESLSVTVRTLVDRDLPLVKVCVTFEGYELAPETL
jgi:hypothetical protein